MVKINIEGREIDVKGLHRVTSNGKTYHYLRVTGKKRRKPIVVDKGFAAFSKSMEKASEFYVSREVDRNLNWLIHEYRESADFKNLAENSRKAYLSWFREIAPRFGSYYLHELCEPEIRGEVLKWRDSLYHKKCKADRMIALLASVLSWAKNRNIIGYNQLTDLNMIYESDRADRVWLDQEMEAFIENADYYVLRGFLLTYFTGQRIGDVLKLKWSDIEVSKDGDSFFRIKQEKTAAKILIHVNHPLRLLLDSIPKKHDVILTDEFKKPWTYNQFYVAFRQIADDCGLSNIHIHDLRGTMLSDLKDAGLSPAHIAVISGHSLARGTDNLRSYLSKALTQAMVNAEKEASKDAMRAHEEVLKTKSSFVKLFEQKLLG